MSLISELVDGRLTSEHKQAESTTSGSLEPSIPETLQFLLRVSCEFSIKNKVQILSYVHDPESTNNCTCKMRSRVEV